MLEYTIEVIMNITMFCYNCSLIILFPLILKTLMKISERWTLYCRQEKGILHIYYYFSIWRNRAICNSSRHSYRPDNAYPRTPGEVRNWHLTRGTKTFGQTCWN